MAINVTYTQVENMYKAKSYPFRTDRNALNIFGIRTKVDTNWFDDTIGIAYINSDGIKIVETMDAATEAGIIQLLHPMNNSFGTFIIAEGFHKDIWKLAHWQKGGYEALVQINSCKGYRDNDRDDKHELLGKIIDSGLIGLQLHRANGTRKSIQVDNWSAACQVVADPVCYAKIIDRATANNIHNPNKFSYALFNIKDVK